MGIKKFLGVFVMTVFRLLALVLMFFAGGAWSMGITPFVHTFGPKKPSIQYTLNNPGESPMAFEVCVFKRGVGPDGKETNVKDTKTFTVFPLQVIVPAKSARNIMLRYVGKPTNVEEAFRVAFEQFPLPTGEEKAKRGATLAIKLRILASLYMKPDGAEPRFEIVSVKKTTKEGEEAYAVRVRNVGNAHGEVGTVEQEVTVFGKKLPLNKALGESGGSTVVLAQTEVDVFVTQKSMEPKKEKKS
jgi:P pilus assembly chaperone PapD